jgi:DNA mismatch repair protein MSH5
MAFYPRKSQTPFKPSPALSAPPGPIRGTMSSRTPTPGQRPTFSSPAPRTGQPPYPASIPSSQSRATRGVGSRSASRVYDSSPPLPTGISRPGRTLRASSGRPSTVDHASDSEQGGRAHDVLSEEGDDTINEIIMAIDMRGHGSQGSTLGCAYYVVLEQTLYLLEDVAMAGVDLVETLLLHAQPTTVLISARAPETLAQFLARGSQDVNGNRGIPPLLRFARLVGTKTTQEISQVLIS